MRVQLSASRSKTFGFGLLLSLPVTIPILLLVWLGVPWWVVVPLSLLVWLFCLPLAAGALPTRCVKCDSLESLRRKMSQTELKLMLYLALTVVPVCASAQYSWEDEPARAGDADPFEALLKTSAVDPLGDVVKPVLPTLRPLTATAVEGDASVEDLTETCGLEPEVARVYRASAIAENDGNCPQYLGRLSANPYATDSTSNPYSPAGSVYSPTSVNNPYGSYGSAYSSTSARSAYATDAPKIVAQDGTYLGKLSDNPYDPDSVSNPYGRYGSPYSPTSINNPYSTYGSPYSSQSPNNPYATQAPLLLGE